MTITAHKQELYRLENVITASAIAARDALKEIRDRSLYKEEFDTFEEYCQTRWNFTAQHVRNLIRAGELAKELPKRLKTIVFKETVARELGKVPASDRLEVAEKVMESGDVSIKGVQDAAASIAVLELGASEASFHEISQLHSFLTGPELGEWYVSAAETMRKIGLFIQEIGKKKHLDRTSFIRWKERIPSGLSFECAQKCVRLANKFKEPISDAKEVVAEADSVLRVVANIGEAHRKVAQNVVTTPASEVLQAICSCRAKITKHQGNLDSDAWGIVLPEIKSFHEMLCRLLAT